MNAWRILSPPTARRLGAVLAAASALAAAGCGFHPVGGAGRLPATMGVTYVASGQPYGYLENALRRAIADRGERVSENRAQASAVLEILHTEFKRRVLAVNTRGQAKEYELSYRVRFRLLDSHGNQLLAPQSVSRSRDLAYSPSIELGSRLRQTQLGRDLQQQAANLILFRLEALARQEKSKKPAR